jgi:hypothetical protein
MTYGSLPSNPFVTAGMIEDSRLFVGREDELQAIASIQESRSSHCID